MIVALASGSAIITYTAPSLCFNTVTVVVDLCPTKVSIVNNLNDFQIRPNPTRSTLVITGSHKISSITITSLQGQAIYAHEYNKEPVEIDVAELQSGVYLIKINGTEVRKFVKQ